MYFAFGQRLLCCALCALVACQAAGGATSGGPAVDLGRPGGTGTQGEPPANPSEPDAPPDTPSEPPTEPPLPGDPYEPVPEPEPLAQAALAAIRSEIDAVVARTSATTAVYIVDAENNQVVYQRAETVPLLPASNAKLYTTGVAFDRLGEEHRLQVFAWGSAAPNAAGFVGTLTLIGEHDFTWSTFVYQTAAFAAEQLARRIYAAGVRQVGTLIVAGEYLFQGEQFGTYDWETERTLAASLIATELEELGISVGVVETSESFARPPGGVLLAERSSPPLGSAVHPLNVYSHNEFADVLGRHNGYLLGLGSSYEENDYAIREWLTDAGLDASGFVLGDGSGLSRANRITAKLTVELLRYMQERPSGLGWLRTFSIGGVLGTLDWRMQDPDLLGRFYGKSGTLSDVICTSGVLFNRHDGRRYLLSALMNQVPNNNTARALQDEIALVVAKPRRGQGTRPAQPVLQEARSLGDGRIALTWQPQVDATAYEVWFSRDARVWRRADARRVASAGRYVAGGLEADSTFHVRLVATNAAGASEPSTVLSATTRRERPSLLIVEGFDRWAVQWENPLRRGHDFIAAHGQALGARSFDSATHDAVLAGAVRLEDYRAVLWQLGEESDGTDTFSAAEQALVRAAVAQGVHLFVSGAEVAWDLGNKGSAEDKAFLREVLHADYLGDDAATWVAEPVANGIFSGLGELGFNTPGTQEVAYPDRLTPAAGGRAELSYLGGATGTAAVSFAGTAKTVFMGFPFEALDTTETRALVMARVLAFFGL